MLGFFSFGGGKNTVVGKYFGSTEEVSALPCHEVEHYYYDDAIQSNQVGYKWLTCHGTYSWGIVTQYDFVVDGECCSCCGYCPEFCDPWGK
jgi:hypothetical protein